MVYCYRCRHRHRVSVHPSGLRLARCPRWGRDCYVNVMIHETTGRYVPMRGPRS